MIVPVSAGVAAGLVPAAQRGRALALVLAGLTAATALCAPLGTALAALTSWRVTMLGVAALGLLAVAGVATLLPPVPTRTAVGMRVRLAPARSPRVSATWV